MMLGLRSIGPRYDGAAVAKSVKAEARKVVSGGAPTHQIAEDTPDRGPYAKAVAAHPGADKQAAGDGVSQM